MSFDRAQRATLAVTTLGSGVAFVDATVVHVALPAMREDLGLGLSGQQWVVGAYLLTLGSLLLLGGALADRLGRRRVLVAGLAAFAVTSLACAVAGSGTFLIVARALQGAAAALLVPSSLALLSASFDDPAARGRAIGLWTAGSGVATLVGPLIGGALVDAASWRWVFAVNVPLIAGILLLATRVPDDAPHRGARESDTLGSVLVAAALGALVAALIEQPEQGWSATVVASGLAGVVLLAAFVIHEGRTAAPMVPLALWRDRTFSALNVATFLMYGAMGAIPFLLVLFLQQVEGWSALHAGLVLLPDAVLVLVLSARFGGLSARIGARSLLIGGLAVAAAGAALVALRLDDDVRFTTDLLPGLAVFGLGLAITIAPLTAALLGAVEQRRAGIASAVNIAVARLGALAAIALLGAVVSIHFQRAVEDRFSPAAAASRAVADEAARRPLVVPRAPGLPARERADLQGVARDAALDGTRLGLGLCAGLLALAALAAAAVPRRARQT